MRKNPMTATLVCALLFLHAAVSAGEPPRDACANGGFESGEEPWHGKFVLDKTQKHSGQTSARCDNAAESDESIVSQTIVLDQTAAIPIVIAGWSKAENVSGRKDRHYSLWCDVEYQNDTRPGKVDDYQNVGFDVGTHDWQYIETIFNPQHPIKHINFHALFRRTHKGTVWFDDLSLRPLSDGPLAGAAENLPPVKPDDPITAMFREQLPAAAPGDVIVSVRDATGKAEARDIFRGFLGDEPTSELPPSGARGLLWKFALQYPPAPSRIHPPPPYAWLRFLRQWEEQKMIIETAGEQGGRVEWHILLPEKTAVRKIALEDWEAQSDGVALRSLGNRLLVSLVTDVRADVDRCVVFLESAREAEAAAPARSTPKIHTLATDDGLRLGIGEDGGVWTAALGGTDLASAEVKRRPFGLLAGDMFQGTFDQGRATVKLEGKRATVATQYIGKGLKSDVCYEAKKDHIRVSGTLEDETGRDRAIDLLLRLPVAGEGWKWWDDIAGATPIGPDSTCERSDVTFACITDPEAKRGIGLALSPEIPCRFKIGFDPNESLFYVRCKYALTPDSKLSQKANFAFSIFPVDGPWGMRDAARRYYAIYPQAFERRAMKEGSWLFAINPTKAPNPEDYGYYEGSPTAAEFNRSKGILTFPYIIAGQRSITHLPSLPANYEDAMRAFAEFRERPDDPRGPELKRIVENCRVVETDGDFPIRIRDDVGADIKPKHPINMVVFSVNCDPDLFADKPDEPTVGRFELSKVGKLIEDHPLIDGIYVDSASSWVSRYQNFRRDHFPYTDFPLTYEDATGRPVIDGRVSMFEFLQGLGGVLHSSNRLVFPNLSCGRKVCWLYFASDVAGLEGRAMDLPTLRYCRTLAYHKPTLRLDYIVLGARETNLAKREGLELFFKRCAFYGIYPSIGRYCDKVYEQFSDVYRTYMPILRRLGAAGWEPVTHASTGDEGLGMERFGPAGGELFFTLYNEGDGGKQARLSIDLPSLGLKKVIAASEIVKGTPLDAANLSISVGPDELKVVALRVE